MSFILLHNLYHRSLMFENMIELVTVDIYKHELLMGSICRAHLAITRLDNC